MQPCTPRSWLVFCMLAVERFVPCCVGTACIQLPELQRVLQAVGGMCLHVWEELLSTDLARGRTHICTHLDAHSCVHSCL